MIAVLLIPVGLVLLFFGERLVFERFWNRDLHVELTFETGARREGEETVLKEVITNRNFLPLPLLTVGYTLERGLVPVDRDASISDRTNLLDIFSLRFYERITRRVRFACTKRGYYRIVRTSLTATDVLTGRSCYCNEEQNTHLYVYPASVSCGELDLFMERLLGEMNTTRWLYEDPFGFRGIRDYTERDPMRLVNWKASARTGHLLVNERDYAGNQKVRILINAEPPSIVYDDAVLEDSLRVAAGLGEFFAEREIPFSLQANSGDVLTGQRTHVPRGQGASQVRALLEALSRAELPADLDGAAFLEELAGTLEDMEETLVLISPCVRAEVREAAGRIARRFGHLFWIVPVTDRTREAEEETDPKITVVRLRHETMGRR